MSEKSKHFLKVIQSSLELFTDNELDKTYRILVKYKKIQVQDAISRKNKEKDISDCIDKFHESSKSAFASRLLELVPYLTTMIVKKMIPIDIILKIYNIIQKNVIGSYQYGISYLTMLFITLSIYSTARFFTRKLKKKYFSDDRECLDELSLVWKNFFDRIHFKKAVGETMKLDNHNISGKKVAKKGSLKKTKAKK